MSNPYVEAKHLLRPGVGFSAESFRYWLDQLPEHVWFFDAREVVQMAVIQKNYEAIRILRRYKHFDDVFKYSVITHSDRDGNIIDYEMKHTHGTKYTLHGRN